MINLYFKKTIDFLSLRHAAVGFSTLLALFSIAGLMYKGLNYGIDFTGGSEVQIKFRDPVQVDTLRDRLRSVNLADSVIQRYGEAADNEVLIRTTHTEMQSEGVKMDVAAVIVDALHEPEERSMRSGGKLDLNLCGWHDLINLWAPGAEGAETSVAEELEKAAKSVVEYRVKQAGVIASYDELKDIVAPGQMEQLKQGTFLGHFTLQRVDRVGPKVSSDLREKAVYAIVFSLLAILAYIWYRFELRFSVAALIADAHDVLLTLGMLAWTQTTFDLTVVAALLTIAGYSLNDSIIILDRVRENMHLHRREGMYEILNRSMTQVLGRSILTSGSTLLVVGGLFFYAGESVHAFSLTMLVGLVIGTYSSTFIVLPTVFAWKRRGAQKDAKAGA